MTSSTHLIFAAGAHALVRTRDSVQCGLDATRAGILATPRATRLSRALNTLHRPTTRGLLHTRLVRIGYTPAAADDLIDELLDYGIITTTERPSALVLGTSALADYLTRLLDGTGIDATLLDPAQENCDAQICAADGVVIFADPHAFSFDEADRLATLTRCSLTVTMFDTRGLIGPTRTGTDGPCPMCVRLHQVAHDPHLHGILQQVAAEPSLRQDPVAVAATAAGAVPLIHDLLGIRRLGGPRTRPPNGSCLLVDAADPTATASFRLDVHPRCPICFLRSDAA